MITEGQRGLKCALKVLYKIEDRIKGGALYEPPPQAELMIN